MRKFVYRFLSFAEIYLTNTGKNFLNTGLDALETASKNIIHKKTERAGKFIGSKIVAIIVKPVEEIIIPPEKRDEMLRHVL